MHSRAQDRSNGFFVGLVTGSAIGAGLAIILAHASSPSSASK